MLPLSTVDGAVAAGGVLALIAANAAVAAVATRFYRMRFATRWALVAYTAVTLPIVYVVTTIVVLGAVGAGTDVTLPRDLILTYGWALPAVLGVAFEVFWMAPPDEAGTADRGRGSAGG
ncbi:MAG: hypothetical protein ABEJ42_08080 [Halobacteriaceae archaeon]